MKRQIQNSYDQIHAPLTLIQQTKQKAYTLEPTRNVHKKEKIWKKQYAIMAAAAASVCLITGTTFWLHNTKEQPTPQSDANIKAGEQSEIVAEDFSAVASEDEWNECIKAFEETSDQTLSLDKAYSIQTVCITIEKKEYKVQIQIQDGVLEKSKNTIYAEGTFYAKTYDGSTIIGETELPLGRTSQFTSDQNEINESDVNGDGVTDFLLETSEDGKTTEEVWYSLSEDGTVWKVE